MIKSGSINVLILAAGIGSRSGLNYHKSLYKVDGRSIISSLISKLSFLNSHFTIVINQINEIDFKKDLSSINQDIEFIYQNTPLGMGDAILKFKGSKHYSSADHVLLTWGDLPFIRPSTFSDMVDFHISEENDFSFITANSPKAYTRVIRDNHNKVLSIIETHEEGLMPEPGERDIGIFIFKPKKTLEMLEKDLVRNKHKGRPQFSGAHLRTTKKPKQSGSQRQQRHKDFTTTVSRAG